MVKCFFLNDIIRFIKLETNVFSKNQYKRKYSIDLIIKEIIYMLKNAISWKDYRGHVDNYSLYYNF
jgi:hypothetical protein